MGPKKIGIGLGLDGFKFELENWEKNDKSKISKIKNRIDSWLIEIEDFGGNDIEEEELKEFFKIVHNYLPKLKRKEPEYFEKYKKLKNFFKETFTSVIFTRGIVL
jgi:type IV secretory pathway VirB4 component